MKKFLVLTIIILLYPNCIVTADWSDVRSLSAYVQVEKPDTSLTQNPEENSVLDIILSGSKNNKSMIVIFAGIIFALLYIVFILFIENRRFKKMIKARTAELSENEERWKFSLEGAGQIEEEVSNSRRMLQMVLDTIPIGVFWKDRDLTYLGCNNSYARLAGIESAESIVGKKDDEVFDVEIARMYNEIDREILNSGHPKLNYEDHLMLPTGKVRILRKSKVPLIGVGGEVAGVLGTSEDVTVQKNLREETFRIRKLESVGILASGIAHDFNNLLMAISGSLSLLRLSEDFTDKNLHWIENAEKSCFAATELTTRLITFSRGGAPVLQEENIVEVINEAVESGSSGAAVKIDYLNESPVNSVMIDGRQVRQVFLNLIENAKEAMPGGGSVYIVSSEINLENNNRLELKFGRYLMITLKDTGPGIPEAIIDKIFDPYFSTKVMGAHKGQGLGLAISHSIITQHGGKITVNSVPGKGALFTVYIPLNR